MWVFGGFSLNPGPFENLVRFVFLILMFLLDFICYSLNLISGQTDFNL